jgi:hypothetical protein
MTKELIMAWAHEAGFEFSGKELSWESVICTEELERFADLVTRKEREARLAAQRQVEQLQERLNHCGIEQQRAVRKEREECAKLLEEAASKCHEFMKPDFILEHY